MKEAKLAGDVAFHLKRWGLHRLNFDPVPVVGAGSGNPS